MSGKYQFQPGGLLMPGAARPQHHPIANLFPMLADANRESFRKSLADGQNHPIVLHKGKILDGRNRERELFELNKPVSYVVFVGTDRAALDFVMDENLERRHLSESQRAMVAASIATLRLGDNQHRQPAPIGAPSFEFAAPDAQAQADQPLVSQSDAADMMSVGRRSVQRAATVQEKGAPELVEAVRKGELAVSAAVEIAEAPIEQQAALIAALPRDAAGKLTPDAKKQVRKVAKEVRGEDQAEKKRKRDEKEQKLGARIRALPEVKAGLIISDFEWHFKVRSEETGMDRHAANHYVTAREAHTPEAIVERQAARMEIAAPDCLHLMWVPAAFSAIGHKVMELQGFTYVSQFVWVKPGIGTGFWVRECHELLLIGVRGKIPAPAMGDQFRSAIEAPRGEHSEKPDFQYEIAEKYFPSLPKVELNARRFREGWIQWGNEAPEVEQPALGLGDAAEAAE
jgi:N6-adenosine-specific RNA methylase IME4